MSEAKRHHYIPQFILKNFLDNKGQVFYWDIEKEVLEKRNPRSIFMNFDMYRDEVNHKDKPTSIESSLAIFEGEIATLIRQKFLKDNEIIITRSELEALRIFLSLLSFRSDLRKDQYKNCKFNESTKTLLEKYAKGNFEDLWKREIEILSKCRTFKDVKMFVAYRNISILKKIDNIINNDLYIGGKWEEKNGISIEAFNYLLKIFPNSIELNKYANSRIGNILKEWFPEADMYEPIFNKYIVGKSTKKIGSNYSEANMKIELEQFSIALRQLEKMLSEAQGFDERVWQEKIHQILQLLYPKYIFSTREIEFKGIDGYDKRPYFLLVDHSGFVDILEIKKPDAQILTKQASYRNNYVPVREFAGAIQQIEKYIFCLTARKENREYVISKLKEKIPIDITPEIVNPQGILLLGRSNEFNLEQKRDFELIKRQYKNIADIMTYDDLIQRLKNIITSFKMKL